MRNVVMTILPLVVVRNGTFMHAALAHEKSAEKTLETKMLWEVHPTTQRVIPVHPHIFIERVFRANAWYVAYATKGYEQALGEKNHEIEMGDVSADNKHEVAVSEPVSTVVERVSAPETGGTSKNDALFLHALYDLVAQRSRTRPQGSYTGHLFASGENKIKKKLGEEVIEVILAKSKEELSEEVADLLYHLIVLLVHSNTSLEACLEVLQKRHAR